MISNEMSSWAKLFPNGRTIRYEGDNPEVFAAEIRTEFDFAPSDDELWGVHIPACRSFESFTSYGFHCPAEHLDVIYGSARFPMGS
jgi:hypothetical protein